MEGLPDAAQSIADLIGDELAFAVCRVYGGIELYIPKHPRPGLGLVEVIGMEAAAKLATWRGGSKIYPPVLRPAGKKRAIAMATGSLTEVARRFGVTRSWVCRVRRGRN